MKATTTTIGKLDALDKNVLGMALFLVSEAVFFTLLIISYITFHSSITGPTASSSLDPLVTGFYSIALFASSGTVWLADRSLSRGSRAGLVGWLSATVLLGGIFLVGQGIEYLRLLNENITISRNLFGSTFFTLTGFHGLHVLVGLIMLAIITGFAVTGDIRHGKSGALDAVTLYWHFVDLVWVFIFSIVYLWTLIS